MTKPFRSVLRQSYSSLEDLQAWAEGLMQQPMDLNIGPDYLHRWWVIPRSEYCNVYLHSDPADALHCHPWDNTSQLIFGEYIEHTPEGVFHRKAGDVINRKATDRHRIEVLPGSRAVSLFMTGPKVNEWGFHCPKGFMPWPEYRTNGGCGE